MCFKSRPGNDVVVLPVDALFIVHQVPKTNLTANTHYSKTHTRTVVCYVVHTRKAVGYVVHTRKVVGYAYKNGSGLCGAYEKGSGICGAYKKGSGLCMQER